MSLQTAWVDKIFTKLTLAYGRDFLGRWEGVSITDVKTDWAHELAAFGQWPEAIAHALSNLSAKPPTVYEFREIAYKCHREKPMQLEAPAKQNPEIVARVKEALAAPGGVVDHKSWARKILMEHKGGIKKNPTSLAMARAALGAQ